MMTEKETTPGTIGKKRIIAPLHEASITVDEKCAGDVMSEFGEAVGSELAKLRCRVLGSQEFRSCPPRHFQQCIKTCI